MKRVFSFTKRNIKELLRDPLSFIFALILPLFLLFIFQQFKIPNDAYLLTNFTPGIIVFGFSFLTMFTAMLVSKDRCSSLLLRLSASPMTPTEYVLGYFLSCIPLAIIQVILFFLLAIPLGLNFSIGVIFSIIVSLFICLLYVALGILIGSFASDKASSGISSVVVQLVAFTSGMYFSSDMLGKTFNFICDVLPFKASVEIIKGLLNLNLENMLLYSVIFLAYLIVITVVSVVIFNRSLKGDKK